MSTAKDSRSDEPMPNSDAPTKAQFESFAARLLRVRKQELDALVSRRHGQRKKRKMAHDP